MTVIHFRDMSVRIPIKDDETIEEIEDNLIEAIDAIAEGVVMSYKISIENYDDE